jgi:hypothetical protein
MDVVCYGLPPIATIWLETWARDSTTVEVAMEAKPPVFRISRVINYYGRLECWLVRSFATLLASPRQLRCTVALSQLFSLHHGNHIV